MAELTTTGSKRSANQGWCVHCDHYVLTAEATSKMRTCGPDLWTDNRVKCCC